MTDPKFPTDEFGLIYWQTTEDAFSRAMGCGCSGYICMLVVTCAGVTGRI